MEFREEHWNEALKTLRQEERKAFLKRWAPWLGLLLLLITGGVSYALLQDTAPDAQLAAEHTTELQGQPYPNVVAPETNQSTSSDLSNQSTPSASPETLNATVSTAPATNHAAVLSENATPETHDPNAPGASPSGASTLPPAAPQASLDAGGASGASGARGTVDGADTPPSETHSPGMDEGRIGLGLSQALPPLNASLPPLKATGSDQGRTTPAPATALQLRGAVLGSPSTGNYRFITQPIPYLAHVFKTNMQRGLTAKKKPTSNPYTWKQPGLFYWAGNSFMTGFGSRSKDLRFNPELGAGYRFVAPNPHFALEVGLSYFSIGGIVHAAHFDQQEAGFGLTTTRTTIQTETLHFAQLPITFQYNAGRRLSLHAGVGMSYLVNSLSEVVVSQFDHQNNAELDRFESWGYVGGYTSFNASLLMGGEFQILPKVWLGAGYQCGLTRITKASIYGVASQDRNSRLRITLKADLK